MNDDIKAMRARIKKAVDALDMKIEYEFVPLSKSRNAKPGGPKKLDDLSLNYRIRIMAGPDMVLEFPYQMGVGYCATHKREQKYIASSRSGIPILLWEALVRECETGKTWTTSGSFSRGLTAAPDPLDILHSLLMDARAIDYTFKDWCGDHGMNDDSIKAKESYDTCVQYGLALQRWFGRPAVETLNELFSDY